MRRVKTRTSPRRYVYSAYGANLHLPGMAVRCPAAERIGTGRLPGWKLQFRGVADVTPAEPPHAVPVALWSITPACLAALDRFEGWPHLYRREILPVTMDGGQIVNAIVYVMNPDDGAEDELRPPSHMYLQSIRDGYRAWSLPLRVLDRAVRESRDYCYERGATGFVPDGRKRMKPVYDVEDVDDESCICESPGMSPATKMLFQKECGCVP